MDKNFELLLERVFDTLDNTDLSLIKKQLLSIKGNTVIVGAGGSMVVSNFASKVLNIQNVKSSRDLNYMNLDDIDNILIVSYSGEGYVIENLLNKNKKIYLLTNGDKRYDNINYIKYNSNIEKEKSFISLASTLMPMSILYYCYTGLQLPLFKNELKTMFDKAKNIDILKNDVYEILTGYDTLTASKYLESTMVESGIAIPIVHDKYDYCHGRSTISYSSNNGLIFFDSGKELDKLLIDNLRDYYNEIVVIERYFNGDYIVDNDFYMSIKSMFLTKKLAKNKTLDLSDVNYSPLVKKLYRYKGEM